MKNTQGGVLTKLHIVIDDFTPLNFTRAIEGLDDCSMYSVDVVGHYTIHNEFTVTRTLLTQCRGKDNARLLTNITDGVWFCGLVAALGVIVAAPVGFYLWNKRWKGRLGGGVGNGLGVRGLGSGVKGLGSSVKGLGTKITCMNESQEQLVK